MFHGWIGKILNIDLSRGKVVKQRLDKNVAASYLGGRGLNVERLYREVGPKVDALDPENLLLFGTGPLTGTLVPCSGRMNINAKSPLTGLLGDSNVGGHTGPELKYAGYDQVVIRGKAEKPVYVWIDGDNVEIRDARNGWGADTWETKDIIEQEIGSETHMATIGPAGENLVKFACIICDKTRAAGRTGMGAVMGSKNLKAVAVYGDKDIPVADPEALEKASLEAIAMITGSRSYESFSRYGTSLSVMGGSELGWLLTHNGQQGVFDKADSIGAEELAKNYKVKSRACYNCPVHCSQVHRVLHGEYAGIYDEKIEYGTLMNMGSNLEVGSLDFLIWANNFANRMGFDTMSCGSLLGWVLECDERGLLTEKDTGGVKLGWGNTEGIKALLQMIVKREGLGAMLAEGVKKASKTLGKGSENFALCVKGCEFSYETRGRKGCCLGISVANTGPVHTKAAPMLEYGGLPPDKAKEMFGTPLASNPRAYAGKAGLVVWTERIYALASSLGICKFVTAANNFDELHEEELCNLLQFTTGLKLKKKELLKIADRIINTERAFVTREGITAKDDFPPRRQLEETVPRGPAKGELIDRREYAAMLSEYYKLRGWNDNGIPTRQKLRELGLGKHNKIKVKSKRNLIET